MRLNLGGAAVDHGQESDTNSPYVKQYDNILSYFLAMSHQGI